MRTAGRASRPSGFVLDPANRKDLKRRESSVSENKTRGRVSYRRENSVREDAGLFRSMPNSRFSRDRSRSRILPFSPEKHSSADEPYRLTQRYHAKPMYVEAEVAREYNKDRDWPEEAAINPERP